jgi:DNA anti-recombination protein RmuC
MAEIPERWILYFEDVDKRDWHFDDRQAAQETLKLQLQSWSCHLFVNAEQLGTAEARIRELEQEMNRRAEDRAVKFALMEHNLQAQLAAVTQAKQQMENEFQMQMRAVTQERDTLKGLLKEKP